jgi:hypothetical protein
MATSFRVQVADSAGTAQNYDLETKPANVRELRQILKVKGDLIFAGGKKPKDDDAIPFDANRIAKCRLFGGKLEPMVSAKGCQSNVVEAQSSERESNQQTSKSMHLADTAEIEGLTSTESISVHSIEAAANHIVVKGLSTSSEIVIERVAGMTYLGVKKAFVQRRECEVSDIRGVKLLGKGGKSPLDTELVPDSTVVLRAMRNERGHDEITRRMDLSEIEKRVENAGKEMASIMGRLYDAETCILEGKRLRDEMNDCITWLDGNRSDLKAKAEAILGKLDSIPK